MSPGPRVKDKTIDEAFQEQCILWERGAPVGVDWDLFNFYMHRNIYSTLKKEETEDAVTFP